MIINAKTKDKSKLSTINIQVRGYTSKDLNEENNQAILNNVGTGV